MMNNMDNIYVDSCRTFRSTRLSCCGRHTRETDSSCRQWR